MSMSKSDRVKIAAMHRDYYERSQEAKTTEARERYKTAAIAIAHVYASLKGITPIQATDELMDAWPKRVIPTNKELNRLREGEAT